MDEAEVRREGEDEAADLLSVNVLQQQRQPGRTAAARMPRAAAETGCWRQASERCTDRSR